LIGANSSGGVMKPLLLVLAEVDVVPALDSEPVDSDRSRQENHLLDSVTILDETAYSEVFIAETISEDAVNEM